MRVKELIDKVIKIARESADNEDGGIQIYTDYRDRELSNETIKTLFESNNPRETLVEMVSDNEMNYSDNYGYYELIETINKRLTDEEREMFIENYDVIFDYIVENIYFYYDIEELNNEINVNIMVDCGNGNYDYARDNVLNWYGRYNDGEFDEESSILWLAKTQEKEDVVALVHNEEYKENALKEFAEKLRNLYNNLDKEETDTMNKEQFFEYIHENFNIDGASQSLILNILDYIEANYSEKNEQYNALCSLLDGTIGLEDRELKKVYM